MGICLHRIVTSATMGTIPSTRVPTGSGHTLRDSWQPQLVTGRLKDQWTPKWPREKNGNAEHSLASLVPQRTLMAVPRGRIFGKLTGMGTKNQKEGMLLC